MLLRAQDEKIGEDVNEVLLVIPEQIWVDVNHKAKYACAFCQGVNDSNFPAVKTAKAEEALIPKSIASPSLLAFILTNKYCDHLPFYRQEKGLSALEQIFQDRTCPTGL
ncbi:hypothetical protein MASR2M29_17580 [Spirochaetota bacterium]